MANNKLYGYTPKTSNEKEGNRLDRLIPSEFRKGMDYELVNMGCYRLAESTIEEREEATEKVIKNLQEYGGYYSALISYETEYRNPFKGQSKPSFKSYLKEMEDYHMIEVDKTYSNDKMTEPKYKKEDYTVPFKTSQLKEAIKKEIKKQKLNEWPWSKGCWIECIECELGTKKWCKPCNRSKCCGDSNKAAIKSKKEGKGGKSACVADNKKAKEAYLNKLYPTRKKTLNEIDELPSSNDGCQCCRDKVAQTGNFGDCCRWCTGGKNIAPTIDMREAKYIKGNAAKSCPCCKTGYESCCKDCFNKGLLPELTKLSENKDDDFDEKEPTKAQIKGIDKSIGDTKEALALAQKQVKELAPDIKKLAKEVNDKIKKNPAGKADYLKVYQSDPDVKAFIKLRKMLKDADLL